MKLLVCDPIEEDALGKIRSAGIDVDVNYEISPTELALIINQYNGLIVRSRTKVTSSILEKANDLRIIVRGGVGLDTIDVNTAQEKGIAVFNTPQASSVAVAELTIGFIFSLARKIPQATASMKAGLWEKKLFEGTEIFGKTLGIIGLGNIGKEVARRAISLGMIVQFYDPYTSSYEGFQQRSFYEVISTSDYLTFHLPLVKETKNMISTNEFVMMKDGVRIINCARGGIIDEDALYQFILNGKVAGAALDVFTVEPPKNNPLLSLDNVISSPHIGASTIEAQTRIGEEIAEIVINFFKR
jgi:D-3-phosphoglycerate dehydrogenase